MSDEKAPPKKVLKKWIRNKSDELAIKNCCRFDETRGQLVCDWIEKYCSVYEGELAGESLKLVPWQRDVLMRMFSWVKWSPMWKRWIRRFTTASIWISKKNGKSGFIAAVGLYLLCGDGENGQKVYCVARDKNQASIQWRHAEAMVRFSPQLDPERKGLCEVNMTEKRIAYKPTLSWMGVVAGDNPKSIEGANGCVLCDEVHVVDFELMRRLKRAGISRSEPFQIEVSTAGDNPDGYGKQQYDYGRRVVGNISDTIDESFFFEAFEAPQHIQVTDANYIELGKIANPSWNILFPDADYIKDYHSSKRSITEFNQFKMYRLGRWLSATNPWLREEDWQACIAPSWKDVFRDIRQRRRGRYFYDHRDKPLAFAGYDASLLNDITAFTLAIPRENNVVVIWTWLWISGDSAARIGERVRDFPDWMSRGFIKVTPGKNVDHDQVAADIISLAKHFRIVDIGFDAIYGTDTVTHVSRGLWLDGKCVVEGIGGVHYEPLQQTAASYALPTSRFEKALLDKKLVIVHNPILSWMAGHCEIRTDSNGNRRPEKPEGHDHRKIDGIVSAIMALSRAQARQTARPTLSAF